MSSDSLPGKTARVVGDWARHAMWYMARLFWGCLPQGIGYRLASLAGDIGYFAWPRGRKAAKANMARVLGYPEDHRLVALAARHSFRNYCRYMVDFLRFSRLTPQEIEHRVVFDDWAQFDAALADGRGAIFVGMHMGNWDLAAAAIAQRNYRVNVIVERQRPPALDRYIKQTREALGMKLIPLESATGGIVRALRRNEILALLIDRPSPDDGVPVSFFGATAHVPAGAALLSLRTGASVVAGALVRLPNDAFLGLLRRVEPAPPSGDASSDIQALTQNIMHALEEMVRPYPEQWYMFRRLWTTPPLPLVESSLRQPT